MAESGDRKEAFRRLYQAYYRPVAAYARRRLEPHDADDAVAEIFLVAWRRLSDVPPGDLTLPWLYGVARRVVSEDRRSGRRRDRLLARLSTVVRTEDAPNAAMERVDEHVTVQSALARLRPKDRELLRLAEWEELTPVELAHVFRCSTNAIAVRLHRAHRRFGQALRSVEAEANTALQKETSTR
jgi:RNA polymerase sigma factor (sigma-70 family)